jgi:MFS family permease
MSHRESKAGLPYHFNLLWVGQATSQLGDYVALFAVLFFVKDQITDEPFWLGLVFAAETLPGVIFGLSSGLLIDRLSRRFLMIGTDLIRSAAFIALALLSGAMVLRDRPLPVVAIAVVFGAMASVFRSSLTAYLPGIVSRDQLASANARLSVTGQTFFILGPLLAGTLIATVGYPVAFGLNAATFLVSAGTSMLLPKDNPRGRTNDNGWRSEMAAGFDVLWTDTRLRLTTLGAFVSNFVSAFFESSLVLLSVVLFGVNTSVETSQLYSALGVGGVLGALSAVWAVQHMGLGRVFSTGLLIWGGGFALMTYVHSIGGALFLFTLTGFGLPWVAVATATIRQKVTPDAYLGRVDAAAKAMVGFALPFGAIALTYLASRIDSVSPGTGILTVARYAPLLLVATAALLLLTSLRTVGTDPVPLPIVTERARSKRP